MTRTEAVVKAAEIAEPVFRRNVWRWSRYDNPQDQRIPSQAEIAMFLVSLSEALEENDGLVSTRSGRFALLVDRDEETDKPTGVRIVLELGGWEC